VHLHSADCIREYVRTRHLATLPATLARLRNANPLISNFQTPESGCGGVETAAPESIRIRKRIASSQDILSCSWNPKPESEFETKRIAVVVSLSLSSSPSLSRVCMCASGRKSAKPKSF